MSNNFESYTPNRLITSLPTLASLVKAFPESLDCISDTLIRPPSTLPDNTNTFLSIVSNLVTRLLVLCAAGFLFFLLGFILGNYMSSTGFLRSSVLRAIYDINSSSNSKINSVVMPPTIKFTLYKRDNILRSSLQFKHQLVARSYSVLPGTLVSAFVIFTVFVSIPKPSDCFVYSKLPPAATEPVFNPALEKEYWSSSKIVELNRGGNVIFFNGIAKDNVEKINVGSDCPYLTYMRKDSKSWKNLKSKVLTLTGGFEPLIGKIVEGINIIEFTNQVFRFVKSSDILMDTIKKECLSAPGGSGVLPLFLQSGYPTFLNPFYGILLSYTQYYPVLVNCSFEELDSSSNWNPGYSPWHNTTAYVAGGDDANIYNDNLVGAYFDQLRYTNLR